MHDLPHSLASFHFGIQLLRPAAKGHRVKSKTYFTSVQKGQTNFCSYFKCIIKMNSWHLWSCLKAYHENQWCFNQVMHLNPMACHFCKIHSSKK